jgi:hypothetical protein
MKNIEEYITLPKEVRQQHLKLTESCVERGAGSYYFKGDWQTRQIDLVQIAGFSK